MCFNGASFGLLGGAPIGFYAPCSGECANYTVGGMVSIYACDPVSVCSGLGLKGANSCRMDDEMKVCCCNTPKCNVQTTPTNDNLMCYVGIQVAGQYTKGAAIACPNGQCSNTTVLFGGLTSVTVFACDPFNLCAAMNIEDKCGPESSANGVSGCCCSGNNFCNVGSPNVTIGTPAPTSSGPLNNCFVGMGVTGKQPMGMDMPCNGDCATVIARNTTMYTCDPISVCREWGIADTCAGIGDFKACCCSSDRCNDFVAPTVTPPPATPKPSGSLKCYVGLLIGTPTVPVVSNGAEIVCNGECANTTIKVQNTPMTIYSCDGLKVCNLLELSDRCGIEDAVLGVSGCCCRDSDNCNAPSGLTIPTLDPRPPAQNESCFVGASYRDLGGMRIGLAAPCQGDCANFTVGGLTVYTCDPISVCDGLGVVDSCGNAGDSMNAMKACCCHTPNCNNPLFVPSKPNLNCFVGLSIGIGPDRFVRGGKVGCDGQCSNTTVKIANGQLPVTLYACDPANLCGILGVDHKCGMEDPKTGVSGCCCDANDYCNIDNPSYVPLFNPPSRHNITCFLGAKFGDMKRIGMDVQCGGDCARVKLGNNTFYTCDPVDVCHELGINGECTSVYGVEACCCHEDHCTDVNNLPSQTPPTSEPMTTSCYAGVSVGSSFRSGGVIPCEGQCANATTFVSGTVINVYMCAPISVCILFGIERQCGPLGYDLAMTGCCCRGKNCNADPSMIPANPPSPPPPILCFEGLYLNGYPVPDSSSLRPCYGDCSSLTFNTSLAGKFVSTTLYTCDPISVCSSFGISNRCAAIDGGIIGGCCCNSNLCIDPTKGIYPTPGVATTTAVAPPTPPASSLKCYVGLMIGTPSNPIVSNGAEILCNGECANTTVKVQNTPMTIYSCDGFMVCNMLQMSDRCTMEDQNLGVSGCCCRSSDNCNAPAGIAIPTLDPNPPTQNESCFVGASYKDLGGIPIGMNAPCRGDCANFTIAGLTVYACDPISVCSGLGIVDKCGNEGDSMNALKGCCCHTPNCNNPNFNPAAPTNKPNLQCFVGLSIGAGNTRFVKGAKVSCAGECSNTTVSIAGAFPVTIYACDPANLCSALQIDHKCGLEDAVTGVSGCCCGDHDFCNVDTPSIVPPFNPPSRHNITCFLGAKLGSLPLLGMNVNCGGDCARISVGNNTFYTCDPVDVCHEMNLNDQCDSVFGVQACCCHENNCNSPSNPLPTKTPLPTADEPNTDCYAGVQIGKNFTAGGVLACDGQCANATTTVSGVPINVYMCVPRSVCRGFGIERQCGTLGLDIEMHACCCFGQNCNVDASLVSNATVIPVKPVVCFEGLIMNGQMIGEGRPSICYGECASLTFNTSFNKFPVSSTLYTCDPVSVCKAFGISNSCAGIDGGIISGCCCKSDMCIDPISNTYPNGTAPTTTTTTAAPQQTTTSSAATRTLSLTASLFAVIIAALRFRSE